ncbi:phage head-tail connector protein [Shinella sp.]|uniref:head-tail connector protein n=1 Tax=Shinella sp. TaxID=1870904 RepID=UPI002587BEE2|nr:phage head-tail connector protein [Shinella sp.]MCW5712464.1 phage head-tail connector protein [Shinella sp.]
MTIAELLPPAVEPVTLAETKAHLRLDAADEDALLSALVRVAREHLEAATGLCLITRPLRLYLDDWPETRVIQIARGPVQTIEMVTVYDAAGLPVAVDASGYLLDGTARPARLLLPARPASGRALNGIEIDFTAGFGESGADVPDGLKRALLLHVAAMFELRGVLFPADQPGTVPAGYDRLVAPYRMRRL